MPLGTGTKKTERTGPKRAKGAWCRKAMAKHEAKRLRRIEDRRVARIAKQEH